MSIEVGDTLYRLDFLNRHDPYACLQTFEVLRVSASSVWLKDQYDNVLVKRKRARKQFAWSTKREALDSLIIRTQKRRKHLEAELDAIKNQQEYLSRVDRVDMSGLEDALLYHGDRFSRLSAIDLDF